MHILSLKLSSFNLIFLTCPPLRKHWTHWMRELKSVKLLTQSETPSDTDGKLKYCLWRELYFLWIFWYGLSESKKIIWMDNLSQVNLILLTQTFHVLLSFSNESKFFCKKIKEEMLKIGKNLKSRFINDNIKNIFRQQKATLLFPRSEFNLTVLNARRKI